MQGRAPELGAMDGHQEDEAVLKGGPEKSSDSISLGKRRA